ncbi:hypothetical protein LJR030_000854 [Rhizobium sp. LjRoot30]|uniref:hypothetical protein n=1 Tax=Rhizobium sp. LjRoot30 TaxID=3342320 RepID=UPI003ECD6B54
MKKIAVTRTVVIAVMAFTMSEQAHAISRYNSMSMSCAEAQATVQREGAAILRYPSKRVAGLTLYDRAVRNRAQCGNYEVADIKSLPTSDNPKCMIRVCVPKTDDDWWLRP